MHPQEQFCQNNDCPARGQIGKGNIRIHSRKDERYQCSVCKSTFTRSKGTVLYGLKKDQADVIKVITLLAYGCPIPAIVVAFGLDVRTVRRWLLKAGQHCQGVHEHFLGQKALDLQQAQADEIKVKTQSGSVWMALAIGWTDHRWNVLELLLFQVPPPRWQPHIHRGRPSNETLLLVDQWCS